MNIVVFGTFLYFLDILILTFSAFLFAYILSPIYNNLLKLGFSRFLSALISLSISITLFVLLLIYSLPKLYIQSIELFKFLNSVYISIAKKYSHIFANNSLNDLVLQKSNISKIIALASTYGYDLVNLVFQGIALIMMSFYMLRDWNLWRERLLSVVPEHYKNTINILFEDIMYSLKIWLYGQILVSMTLFIYYFLAFKYIDMPFAFLLACIFGLATIIPYIGDIFSLITLTSILSGYKPFISELSIYAFALLLLGFILENVFIIPSFIGKKAGIHPLFLLILFLIFGKILGLSGVILTIPLSVIFAAIWRTGIIKRRWS